MCYLDSTHNAVKEQSGNTTHNPWDRGGVPHLLHPCYSKHPFPYVMVNGYSAAASCDGLLCYGGHLGTLGEPHLLASEIRRIPEIRHHGRLGDPGLLISGIHRISGIRHQGTETPWHIANHEAQAKAHPGPVPVFATSSWTSSHGTFVSYLASICRGKILRHSQWHAFVVRLHLGPSDGLYNRGSVLGRSRTCYCLAHDRVAIRVFRRDSEAKKGVGHSEWVIGWHGEI